jgi:thiamine pyrophosphate-dependent acetolactate synthase large subunit-like protein
VRRSGVTGRRDPLATAPTTVSEAVAATLAHLGVEVAFGLTGNSNLSLAMDMTRGHGIRFVTARHESAAVSMADGWARVTRRTGVCTVTRGPGVSNALTGLIEAQRSRTPLLFVGGEVPGSALHHNQMLDHEGVLTSAGIATERVRTAATVTDDVARAFHRCERDRCPVGIFVRPELLRASSPGLAAGVQTGEEAGRLAPTAAAIAALRDVVLASERPVIVAGRGAADSGDAAPYLELAERIGAVVATTAPVKGFFGGSHRDVGICGGFASRAAKSLFGQADLVLAFGASLNEWTMGHGRLFSGARVVLVDTDRTNLGRLYPLALGVHADAPTTARSLAESLTASDLGSRPRGFADGDIARCTDRRTLEAEFDDGSDEHGVDPRTLMVELDGLLPADRLLVTDSGHFMGFPMTYLRVRDERSVIFPQAYQAMGVGLGNAIGAALAAPGRIVVTVVGDGGFMMMPGDLETAVRQQLPLLVVVMNDSAFGAEYHHLAMAGLEATDAIVFDDVDFASVARSYGARAVSARTAEELAQIADWVADPSGPLVVDAKVTRSVRADWFSEAWGAR